MIRVKDEQIEECHVELGCAHESQAQNEQMIDELLSRSNFIEHPYPHPAATRLPNVEQTWQPQSRWSSKNKAPCTMRYFTATVRDDCNIYIHANGNKIYAFTNSSFSWSLLTFCPSSLGPLVVIKSMLTSVGGISGGEVTNKLVSYLEKRQRWMGTFQPIPTQRANAAALYAGKTL